MPTNIMPIKIGQFSISNAEKTGFAVCTFLLEPDSDLEIKLGKLCFVLQIDFGAVPLREDLEWAKDFYNNLKNFLEKQYYQSLKNTLKIDKDFENLLQKLNQWLKKEVPEDKTINLLLGVANSENAYFANIGNLVVHLIQNGQITELTLPEQKDREKFTDIVSGSLEDNDILIFSTANLLDYFSREKIKQIVQEKSVNEIIGQLEKLTNTLANQISIGIIFLKEELEQKTMEPEKLSSKMEEKKSTVNHFEKDSKKIDEEKEEQEISKPPSPKYSEKKNDKPKYVKDIKDKTKLAVDRIKEEFDKLSIHAEKVLKRPTRPKILIFRKIFRGIILILTKISQFFRLNLLWAKFSNRFNRFSYLQRTIIIFALILAIIFVYSLFNLGRQEYQQQLNIKYNFVLEEIEKKQNELSAALIYNDEEKAKILVSEVDTLLQKLPRQNEEQQQAYNYFSAELQSKLEKIYHQERLTELKIVTNLAESQENINPGGLIKLGDFLYTYNPDNNFVYQIDINNGQISQINQESANIGYLDKTTALDKDSILFSHSNQGLAVVNTITKKLIPLELHTNHQNAKITNIFVYLNRLYLLDSTNNQIFKYNKTAGGFNNETSWIQEEDINLQDANSLAIDGSIYVASSNQILKFYQGKKQDFDIDKIYPALSQLTKISTWLDSKYIYLLEPTNKRFIILNKKGQLIKQIISDYFDELIDFAVNEKEDIAWLLNGTKIIEIKIK